MTPSDNEIFEAFLPLYDVVPEKWEDARAFLVEQIKRMGNAINVREIGWYLDEELLSGKQFIPGLNDIAITSRSDTFRQIFRKVIDCSPLAAGPGNSFPHGITFDANFTLIQLWCSGTNSTTFNAVTITGNDVTMNATNINITSPGAFDRGWCVVEYLLEE